MSLENPHKIAKKDGHLHEIATKDGRLPYLVILCHYTVVRVSWRVLGKVHTYKILFNIVTSPIEIVPHSPSQHISSLPNRGKMKTLSAWWFSWYAAGRVESATTNHRRERRR
jgi:hypothetical protein